MKILQVVHSFPPHNIAGTETYTYNLCSELAKKHEIFVFHRISDKTKRECEVSYANNGFHVYSINNTFKHCDSFEKIYKNENISRSFGEILDRIKPDIAHIQHLAFLSTTIIEEIRSRGIPIVYTLHDYWLFCPQAQLLKRDFKICNGFGAKDCIDCQIYQLSIKKGVKRFYQAINGASPYLSRIMKKVYLSFSRRVFLNSEKAARKIKTRQEHIKSVCGSVDIFIAPSKYLKDRFIEWGLDSKKIIFSSYGFRKAIFNGRKNPMGGIRFGYIGTLLPHKGLDVLIKAFNKITSSDAQLHIYGKLRPYAGFEYYPRHLKGLVKNRNIRFMGHFDNSRLGEIFSDIDVLIVPSIWPENSPLVIQEAFLAKTPVIASDIGGTPELVKHDVNGLLFRANDSEDLCNKIKALIENPEKIEKLGRNVGAIKTIEENAIELEGLYSALKN